MIWLNENLYISYNLCEKNNEYEIFMLQNAVMKIDKTARFRKIGVYIL